MLSSPYYPGSYIILSAQFSDPASGAGVDPTTVTVQIQQPDGTIATPTPSRISTGYYTAVYVAPVSGTFTQRWVGAGANAQVSEATFAVLPSGIL